MASPSTGSLGNHRGVDSGTSNATQRTSTLDKTYISEETGRQVGKAKRNSTGPLRVSLVSIHEDAPLKSMLKRTDKNLHGGISGSQSATLGTSTLSRSSSGDSLATSHTASFKVSPTISRTSSTTTLSSIGPATPPDSLTRARRHVTIGKNPVTSTIIVPRDDQYIYESPVKGNACHRLGQSTDIPIQM